MHRKPLAGLPSRHFRPREVPVTQKYLEVDDMRRCGSEGQIRIYSRDYESPSEPLKPSQGSNSFPLGQPTLKWVSSGGAGGLHFPTVDDSEARYREKLSVIQRQTMKKSRGGINQALQGYTDYNILEHMVPQDSANSNDPRIRFLTNYEINSRFMTSALKAENLTPCRPPVPPRKHWLYEENSDDFDIISNRMRPC